MSVSTDHMRFKGGLRKIRITSIGHTRHNDDGPNYHLVCDTVFIFVPQRPQFEDCVDRETKT